MAVAGVVIPAAAFAQNTAKFYEAFDQTLYSSLGLGKAIQFDAENFGKRTLVTGYGKRP